MTSLAQNKPLLQKTAGRNARHLIVSTPSELGSASALNATAVAETFGEKAIASIPNENVAVSMPNGKATVNIRNGNVIASMPNEAGAASVLSATATYVVRGGKATANIPKEAVAVSMPSGKVTVNIPIEDVTVSMPSGKAIAIAPVAIVHRHASVMPGAIETSAGHTATGRMDRRAISDLTAGRRRVMLIVTVGRRAMVATLAMLGRHAIRRNVRWATAGHRLGVTHRTVGSPKPTVLPAAMSTVIRRATNIAAAAARSAPVLTRNRVQGTTQSRAMTDGWRVLGKNGRRWARLRCMRAASVRQPCAPPLLFYRALNTRREERGQHMALGRKGVRRNTGPDHILAGHKAARTAESPLARLFLFREWPLRRHAPFHESPRRLRAPLVAADNAHSIGPTLSRRRQPSTRRQPLQSR